MIESWAFAILIVGSVTWAAYSLFRWLFREDERADARRRNRR